MKYLQTTPATKIMFSGEDFIVYNLDGSVNGVYVNSGIIDPDCGEYRCRDCTALVGHIHRPECSHNALY